MRPQDMSVGPTGTANVKSSTATGSGSSGTSGCSRGGPPRGRCPREMAAVNLTVADVYDIAADIGEFCEKR